ncbi:MAG: hypothetical protein AUJ12_08200 [Alphaproteobacteria bacterium CG1_02_46_17]|nr:MAG: hypothetical protein AUJ12_08200 [Alphaproteobacteria bacterium CG1_02_46_17]
MSKHDQWQFRIRHMNEAIQRIQDYTGNMSCSVFVESRMVRDAVERNFEIIGEATAKIPQDIQDKYSNIPWHKMKAMRNFIIHQYDEVEEVALWNTIQKDLPPLLMQLQKVLGKEK